ncbi:MAG: type II toxin-antitoxin system VapC family toxin [Bauldia sp.]|uniref:type II toxin-antitoxin system VapC family toxin n=1 Tax=Bauldia sp. TaxID=2575872 RepID=UPI001D7E76B6|nr:type II toxin-antitoxin system VapC family toxin [Bauldia sp.]MCB1489675.1 type II toxin-antitoxin system VapC family toxin [Bauldia sp.]MCB1496228.1 type II toxin-antitoxin system VapC family toxin [Bauldia sp.]
MIALDTSAIVAIALAEPEEEAYSREIARREALVGTPTLLEVRLVLASKVDDPDAFVTRFLLPPQVHSVAFSLEMYAAATQAFDRFGKGRGHPAQLNICDCMAYAVASTHGVPLLFKGDDFAQTDIAPALP